MKLPACVGCSRPVLELEGQYADLVAYTLDAESMFLAETEGSWHVACLHESDYGAAWGAALLRNYLRRKYEIVGESLNWSVVRSRHMNETIAVERQGDTIELPSRGAGHPLRRMRIEAVAGRLLQIVTEQDFNLELPDAAAIADMQAALRATGTYPLMRVVDVLGIKDRIVHPEILASARFRFTSAEEHEWGKHCVNAALEYARFVPDELEPFLTSGQRS